MNVDLKESKRSSKFISDYKSIKEFKHCKDKFGGEGRACNALMAFKKVQAMATIARALVT
jgi:hypothetical protein